MKATTLATATVASLPSYSEPATATSMNGVSLLVSPQEFEEQAWQHQGCYVDVGRTIYDVVSTEEGMTNAKCTDFCFNRGFVYAGTEYYSECYCGNFLARGAKPADAEDCNTQYAGNSTEACGGRNRLTLYKTSKITSPAVNPGIGDWESLGCHVEGSTGRALERQVWSIPASIMTAPQCMSACDVEGYALAGVEYGRECFCGNELKNWARPATYGGCTKTCSGNRTEYCGGSNRLNLYQNKLRYTPPPTSTPPTSASTTDVGTTDIGTTTPKACPNQPGTIARVWKFDGCYTEGDGVRALNDQAYSDNEMTLDDCSRFCQGFAYFGLEYGRECYCGNSFAGGAVKTSQSECSMICPGGQECGYCGAGNRLSVYLNAKLNPSSSSVTSIRSTYTTSSTSSHISSGDPSCVSTSATPTLPAPSSITGFNSTTFTAISSVVSSPSLASSCPAVSISDTNRITTSSPPSSTSVGNNSSSIASTSDSTPVIAVPTSIHSTSTTGANSTSSTGALSSEAKPSASTQAPVTTPSWNSTASTVSSIATSATYSTTTSGLISTLTWHNSTTGPWATSGWNATHTKLPSPPPISSTRKSTSVEPTAGPSTQPPEPPTRTYPTTSSSSTEVTFVTTSTFFTTSAVSTSTSTFLNTTSTRVASTTSALSSLTTTTISTTLSTSVASNSSSATSVKSTATPMSTSLLPNGWNNYGCWVDGAQGRILNKQLPDSKNLTLESCASSCAEAGFKVAGTEFHSQCFCGNYIVNGGTKAKSEDECNTPCSGNPNQFCGGGNRMTIMSLGEPKVQQPPTTLPQVGNWKYQGCYEDNVNQSKVFFWQNFFPDVMTPAMCLDRCADFGYMAAGLEYGQECYCGDPQNIVVKQSTKKDEKECNVPCAGNASAFCGGGSRLSTYFWDAKPFYSWDFPEAGTPEAGSYDFLIGGTNIPLITSQAINGKVTFLEKFGTGPPNSTGAYELDLSEIDNWDLAWRTMHVKTDIFCAAGLTLPDKAGRQINIGGWSGASTFGIRLYSPDGKAGVHGKNDWEEDASVLKLQDGRWYPTAMNMANGSVLIIGGEEGSNSAPVPTLEILPYTGTKPLRMDWLERTDPNNLYPFAAVLPSGGIFVAYWNEARILDENTFDTVKTLPLIPGAVNDPKGGRTYPLEGTAVLLPQHAPYTDPLGVLICGGSTNGPNNALDNCVSTYPDAASPKWELERMPSTRVMSCMAPLPDGTYVILNGAHHGVAGFGLGVDPNLNALLYDPKKPLGHRITVMANTTVARLYHSEGITLLDGRVLVTGSDPQDGVHPQEYRIETFTPPYLLSGKPRPKFTVQNTDWSYGQKITVELGGPAVNGDITVSLLGSVSSTHGNSMGARTLFPEVSCSGTSCTVTAPPGKYIAPPGWYQFFVLDGGIPAVGVFVRIGGDPAGLGNWPKGESFTRPGV